MPLVRCPQCGRVADGRSCFACGYDWPGGSKAAPSTPAAKPPAAAAPAFTPLAPPRAPASEPNPFTRTGTPSPRPPSSFTAPVAPPPPDEIVVDMDFSFSVDGPPAPAAAPSRGPLPSPPPGLPPPPPLAKQPTPGAIVGTLLAPPQRPADNSTLDALFDGIDINVPRTASQVSDATMEAGDFLSETAPEQGPPEPFADEWSSTDLGADLVSAFNAPQPEESEMSTATWAQMAANPSLADRLRLLASRLRAEGRTEDADLVTEALSTINLQM